MTNANYRNYNKKKNENFLPYFPHQKQKSVLFYIFSLPFIYIHPFMIILHLLPCCMQKALNMDKKWKQKVLHSYFIYIFVIFSLLLLTNIFIFIFVIHYFSFNATTLTVGCENSTWSAFFLLYFLTCISLIHSLTLFLFYFAFHCMKFDYVHNIVIFLFKWNPYIFFHNTITRLRVFKSWLCYCMI